jgi:aconitate hydratase
MVNGLGVLGWGVGGIEAEAAMLGQPLPMLTPRVVGFRLSGALPEGSTATDLVLRVTEVLRAHGVVGAFVEFHGPGVATVPVENRATIGNMSPEYGSTCAIFPIDADTLRYLRFTGRSDEHVALVEAYAKEQGLWHEPDGDEPVYSEELELDLSTVVPSLAGPARPQDRVPLDEAKARYREALDVFLSRRGRGRRPAPRAGAGGRRPVVPRARPAARRQELRRRSRVGRHRRHHQLHQHLQPVGDGRRRAGGGAGRGTGSGRAPLGQDVAGPGVEGGR